MCEDDGKPRGWEATTLTLSRCFVACWESTSNRFDWPVERRLNDVVDYVNGSIVTSLYSVVTRLLM